MKKILLLLIFLFLANKAEAATDFVSIIDPGGSAAADFSSLASWQSVMTNTATDITVTGTRVFSGAVTGSINNNVTVYQCRGTSYQSKTGIMIYDTKAGQALVKSITAGASFQPNDRWYTHITGSTCDSASYFTISNTGDSAIAVAKCRTTTGAADTAAVTIDGWTTSATNYIKIWTDPSENYRHQGKWDDTKYRLSVSNTDAVLIREDYVRLDGLQVSISGSAEVSLVYDGTYTAGNNENRVSNSIIKGTNDPLNDTEKGIYLSSDNLLLNIWNTVVYNIYPSNNTSGTLVTDANSDVNTYSSTFIGGNYGVWSWTGGEINCKNCYSGGAATGDYTNIIIRGGTLVTSASSDGSGSDGLQDIDINTNNFTNVTAGSEDYHLAGGSDLKDAGTNTSAEGAPMNFNTDIDGDERSGDWDIGADEWHGTIVQASQTDKMTANLVGLWSFNGQDISGSTAYDRSGLGHDGTINGATPVIGKRGQALSFNGASSTVTVGNTGQSIGSVDFWVKPGSTSQYLIDFDGGSHYIRINSGSVTAFGFSPVTIYVDGVAGNTISDTNWHHIAVTTSSSFSASNLILGKVGSNYFTGSLDEVRIYSGELSADQVASLAGLGAVKANASQAGKMTDGLVGHWTFDGPDVNMNTHVATDRSGNGNDGTISGATPVIGKLGQALSFNGSSSYVDAGDIDAMDGLTRITVSAWVKWGGTTEGMTGEKHITEKSECDGVNGTFELLGGAASAHKAEFLIYNGNVDYTDSGASATSIDDGNWHFLSGVYDGSRVRIYVDGVDESSAPDSNKTLQSNVEYFQIGGSCNSHGSYFWPGQVDEVRVYSRALTLTEIGDLYRMGHAKVAR